MRMIKYKNLDRSPYVGVLLGLRDQADFSVTDSH